jgi:hypothetical protein
MTIVDSAHESGLIQPRILPVELRTLPALGQSAERDGRATLLQKGVRSGDQSSFFCSRELLNLQNVQLQVCLMVGVFISCGCCHK